MRTIGTASLVESHCFDFGAHAVRGLSGAGCFHFPARFSCFVFPVLYTMVSCIWANSSVGKKKGGDPVFPVCISYFVYERVCDQAAGKLGVS